MSDGDPIEPPAALVLGCNTPHGIGVLSDWIEERTGHPPDFEATGWSDVAGDGYGYGYGYGYGSGYGDGYGDGVTQPGCSHEGA